MRSNGGGTPLRAGEETIASIPKARGYATGGFGKWGCGGRDSTGVPEKHGFDVFFGYYDQVHAHTSYPPYLIRNSEEVKLEGINGGGERKTYSHYVIHQEALKFIREHAKEQVFAYVPYTPPHGNFSIPDSDPAWALYQDKPRSESARRYAAMVTMVDRQMGEILALLKELGLEKSTLIFFSGDNGAADYFESKDYWRNIARAPDATVSGGANNLAGATQATVGGGHYNCASGYTPWNTYLACEENWGGYFRRIEATDNANRSAKELKSLGRYGVLGNGRELWATVTPDSPDNLYGPWNAMVLGASAADDYRNGPNTYGWNVEIDPFAPNSTPKKRTAMGRFAHEGAWIAKVEELDPTYFNYGPARYWGAYYAALPSFAGQDLTKSGEYFEASIQGGLPAE